MVSAFTINQQLLESDDFVIDKDWLGDTVNLHAATQAYLRRKSRAEHPEGSFDKQGRWWPSAQEHQDCCAHIRSPTRSYPYSLMLHCRTAEHVANLHGVTVDAMRQALRNKS